MAVENRRIVVLGAPRTDRAVSVLVVDRELARRLAEDYAADSERTQRELRALLQGAYPSLRRHG